MRNRPMKNVIACGGLMLALYALGRLLERNRGVLAGHQAGPQPRIPPCTYTYKDVVCNLN
jgi:hypothetical protein